MLCRPVYVTESTAAENIVVENFAEFPPALGIAKPILDGAALLHVVFLWDFYIFFY